jgi:hypothetical protein
VLYYLRKECYIIEQVKNWNWYLIDDYLSPTGIPICILANIRAFNEIDVVTFYHARYLSNKYIVYEKAVPTLDSTNRIRDVGCKLEESEVIYARKGRSIA